MDCRRCPYADRIKLLEGIILEGKKAPDLTWERAVEAAKRGDWEPFKRYKMPEEEAEGRRPNVGQGSIALSQQAVSR